MNESKSDKLPASCFLLTGSASAEAGSSSHRQTVTGYSSCAQAPASDQLTQANQH